MSQSQGQRQRPPYQISVPNSGGYPQSSPPQPQNQNFGGSSPKLQPIYPLSQSQSLAGPPNFNIHTQALGEESNPQGNIQSAPGQTIHQSLSIPAVHSQHTNKNLKEVGSNSGGGTAGFLSRIEHKHRSYGYCSLFRFSTKCEKFFLLIGFLFAIAGGVCMPLMVREFGILTNDMVVIDMITENPAHFNRTYATKPPFCVELLPNINNLRNNPTIKNSVIKSSIYKFVLWHSVFALILMILSIIYFMCWFMCGENQINRLSVAYFEAMLRKDMKWMDTRKEDSNYVNSIVDQTARIREGIGEKVGIAAFLFSIFVSSMALAFFYGWELTLVTFIAIPLLIVSTSIVATTEVNQVVEESKTYSKAGALVKEILLNIRTVMVYGGQKKEFAEFHTKLNMNQRKILKRATFSSFANGFTWFITYANYALSFWYGSKLVLEDREGCRMGESSYTPGDLVIILFGVLFGAINIGLAFPIIENMMVAKQSSREIFHIIDTTSEVDNLSIDGYIPDHPATGKIELTDVFFTYPARRNVPILRGVSFKVSPGQTIALVGTSGCGKSTILKLLTKEYLSDSGFIKLDSVDIRAFNTVWLRSQIAVVTQESSLFDDTIEENVRIGNPDASFVEVQLACKQANAHEFICQLKKGYQTLVGFQGSKLSGGQRQRISIARALIRNPKILLLDEPTSALDNQSEAVVQEALRKASINRTTFVVAHRLNTIINSDVILVFNRGQIAERGTHVELLAKKGLYYQLAAGEYDKPSDSNSTFETNEPKRGNNFTNKRNSSLIKVLDNLISTPFRNSISFGLSEKIIRRMSMHPGSQREEDENDDVVFTINPIQMHSLEGEGDMSDFDFDLILGRNNELGNVIYKSSHFGPNGKMENTLWQEYTKKLEWESRSQIVQAGPYVGQLPPAAVQYTHSNSDFQFCPILGMVSLTPFLIFLGILGSIGMGCTLPLYGVLFGNIVGELSNHNLSEAVKNCTFFSILFFGIGGLACISVFVQSFTLTIAGHKAVGRVRKRILFSILRQDVGWFDDPDNGISALNTSLNNDAGSVQYIVLSFYGVLVQCFATVTVAILYCFYFAWRLTAYCLFLVPIVIGASWLDGWLSKIQEERTNIAMDTANKIVLEVFQNRRIVLTSQLERYFIAKYERALINSNKSSFGLAFMRSLAFGFAQSAAFLTYSVCIYVAGFEIVRPDDPVKYSDVLKVGDGLIFALLTVGTSLSIIPSFVKAIRAGNRILRILRTRPKFDFDIGGDQVMTTTGAIELKDVQFWYPHATDVHILKGISFSVKSGQMVALVGSSGSGKSTCVQLILRFHECIRGAVMLDGVDVKRLNCASMRSHMSLVEQEPRLFDRTVAENIAYGDNSRVVAMHEVIDAANAANIHTFITSLPEGYQTKVGSSGSLLSGGQKQRIAIARALLRNPQILVLDEATAALDHESEKIVQESLEIARKGRSCIAVAHRLSSIKQADMIVVMHQGNIVEFGSHDSLLAKRGLYSLLWMAQNPLANDNFLGTFKFADVLGIGTGNQGFASGGSGSAPRPKDIGVLAEYAQTARPTNTTNKFALSNGIVSTDANPNPNDPVPTGNKTSWWSK